MKLSDTLLLQILLMFALMYSVGVLTGEMLQIPPHERYAVYGKWWKNIRERISRRIRANKAATHRNKKGLGK